jgi:UTP--glucose-1-phosphate uridylyltransferase
MGDQMKVRKAVIPAAGLGTRFLPATKTVPKELLPIVDRPAIHLVVEEAVAAGIEEVVIIGGRGKSAIIDYFDHAYELEDTLERRGKIDLFEEVRRTSTMVRIIEVRQKRPLGLGHAVLCARPAVGDEPFAVLLPDDIFVASPPATGQLLRVFEEHGEGVVGLLDVPREDTSKYGIVQGRPVSDRLFRVEGLVEKPAPAVAPSTLAVPGRYVLPARIFDHLEKTEAGVGGEIQLTDALAQLAREDGLYGWVIDGERFDTGNQLGFLKANITFAFKRDDLAPELESWLRSILDMRNDS